MNEQMPDAVREGAESAEKDAKKVDPQAAEQPGGDLGAGQSEPLRYPDQAGQEGEPRQPRPDEIEPGEPLGAPDDPTEQDPLTEDPSRARGEQGEDVM